MESIARRAHIDQPRLAQTSQTTNVIAATASLVTLIGDNANDAQPPIGPVGESAAAACITPCTTRCTDAVTPATNFTRSRKKSRDSSSWLVNLASYGPDEQNCYHRKICSKSRTRQGD